MADNVKLIEDDSKRKRSENSSISELELSTIEEGKKGKQRKKKQKKTDINQSAVSEIDTAELMSQMKNINLKLEKLDGSIKKINERFENVMIKGDGTLRETMKELLREMKDGLLKSVEQKMEILEGKLFERDQENDRLKTKIATLETTVANKVSENDDLKETVQTVNDDRKQFENESEQYSRRNNIKIRGIPDLNPMETAYQTGEKVAKVLEQYKIFNLKIQDVDIAHRLPNKTNKNRDIIVKLVSRYVKDIIMWNRKKLHGSGIFINEDLTRTNLHVLMCVKKKALDEVNEVWTRNGSVMYKDKQDKIHKVTYSEFHEWIDLPWPHQDIRDQTGPVNIVVENTVSSAD